MTHMFEQSSTRRRLALASVCIGLMLAGCGNDKSQTEVSKWWGKFLKEVGSDVATKVGRKPAASGAGATAQPADPNAAVTASLAATSGPIALVVREETKAVAAMTPVETNGSYVTWLAANKQSIVLQNGVLVSTRGLGEDLMSSKPGRALTAVRGKQTTSYRRSYFHLTGLAETTELVVKCSIKPMQQDQVAIGEINQLATVMSETCRHDGSSLKIKNLYWVGASGRVLKSRQWVNGPIGYMVVQPLR